MASTESPSGRWPARLAIGLVLAFAMLTAVALRPPSLAPVPGVDVAIGRSPDPPATGWQARRSPPGVIANPGNDRYLFIRVRFSTPIGSPPLALMALNPRERLLVQLNGVDIFSNAARPDEPVLGWNHPYRVNLPPQLLHAGENRLILRIDSYRPWVLGMGKVWLAPADAIEPIYRWYRFWQVDGACIANTLVLGLTIMTLLLWQARRQERELLLLTLVGLGWCGRNLHFFIDNVPIDAVLFASLSRIAAFIVVPLTFAFVAEHLRPPHCHRIIVANLGIGVANGLLHLALIAGGRSDLFCIVVLVTTTVVTLGLLIRSCWQRPDPERLTMVGIMAINLVLGVHDLGRVRTIEAWDGLGFFAQPYAALMLFGVFFLAVGRRFLAALAATESMNEVMAERVAAARVDLARSEAERRKLEIASALENERERLMREMHDGIGSNLMTALAVAEQQQQPESTVRTLKKALAELKITVDSLEPVDGDIVALIANLRHRMAPDLAEAGLASHWQVSPCPPLPWLDATNALHVLRLVQEAVGNAIAHACARAITIGCQHESRDGIAGIKIFVADDGAGMAAGVATAGRGLANMRKRAEALHGDFACQTAPGAGTLIALWLPLARGGAGPPRPV